MCMRSNLLARRQDQPVFAHRPSDFEVGQLNTSSQRSGDGEAAWTASAGKTACDPVVRHAATTEQPAMMTQAVIARSSGESAILHGTATVLA